jgi:hypothetical protein
MGATGTTTINFGAFPGKSDASVVITGQAAIVAGSLVEAWIRPVATADHTDTEHMVETLKVFAADIVAGVGFTIYAFNTSQLNEPVIPPRTASTSVIPTAAMTAGRIVGTGGDAPEAGGGEGTRIYGLFTIAWVWN